MVNMNKLKIEQAFNMVLEAVRSVSANAATHEALAESMKMIKEEISKPKAEPAQEPSPEKNG